EDLRVTFLDSSSSCSNDRSNDWSVIYISLSILSPYISLSLSLSSPNRILSSLACRFLRGFFVVISVIFPRCWPVAVIVWVELLVFGCQKLWGFLAAVWWYDRGLVWLGRGGMVAILGGSCCRFGEGCLSRQWWPFWFRNYCHSHCYYGRRVRTVLTPFEHRACDCWAADLAGLEWLIFMCLWVVGVVQRSVVDRGFRCSFVTEFSCGADLKRTFGWVSYVGVAIGLRYFIVVDVVVFLVLSVIDLEFWKSIRGAHFRWGSVWAVSPRLSFRAYRQASFIFLKN
ncbi:hypothetical protein GIB67_037630, partial [Kingdonia uniflora]